MDSPVAFDAIDDHDALITWSRAYCQHARREWRLDVRLDLVEWSVSTRACRRAAAVKRPRFDGATVGKPIDWDDVPGADGRPLPCTMSLTWGAFREFSRAEWAATLRHELVHVEQYQYSGTTGHGTAFERRAREVDTEVHCRTFAEARWRFLCEGCDNVVARRYRDCPFVREYDQYRSDCCGAALRKVERSDCGG